MKTPKWTDLKAKHLNRRTLKLTGIVLHDTAGSGTHNDTLYLANPSDGRKVSVDFTVEKDGGIWKLNPDLKAFCCNHAGRATEFKGLINAKVNQGTIGIEICQKSNLPASTAYPPAQVESVANLCAWLVEEFKLSTSDITTHRQIITDGSRSDPRKFPFEGKGGFWESYWEAKNKKDEFVLSTSIGKTPVEVAGERSYAVKKGDTLSSIAKKLLGKASLWPRIQKANSLKGTLILTGQVLRVPLN